MQSQYHHHGASPPNHVRPQPPGPVFVATTKLGKVSVKYALKHDHITLQSCVESHYHINDTVKNNWW